MKMWMQFNVIPRTLRDVNIRLTPLNNVQQAVQAKYEPVISVYSKVGNVTEQ